VRCEPIELRSRVSTPFLHQLGSERLPHAVRGFHGFTPLSDAGGAIRTVVLHLVPNAPIGAYLDIVRALPHARFLGVVHAPFAELAERALIAHGVARQFELVPIQAPELTMWARDAYCPGRDAEGQATLLVPGLPERIGPEELHDRRVPRPVAAAVGARIRQSGIYFEGGNIVSDEAATFMGLDVVLDNEGPRGGRAAAPAKFVVVGCSEAPPPLGHLDMFVTLLGEGEVIVGDSAAAVAVLASLPATRLAALERYFRDGERDWAPFSLASLILGAAKPTIVGGLDSVARAFETLGYRVYRMPLLMADVAEDLPVLSYNNVLLERTDQRRVLVPRWGVEELDAAAEHRWSALGWDPCPIDLSSIPDLYGAVRCLTQVLQREGAGG
jgi:hypothetical protein